MWTLTIHNAVQHRSHVLIYWRSFSTISFLVRHCTPLWLQSYKAVFCMIKSLKVVESFLHCTYSHIYNPNIIYLKIDTCWFQFTYIFFYSRKNVELKKEVISRKKFPRICICIEAYLSTTQITKLAPTCHYSLSPCRNPYVSRISCMGANTLSVTRARARTHLPVHLSGTHPAVA